MTKFAKWELKYQDMWYSRGVLTHSGIFSLMFDFVQKYGRNIKNDEMFPTESYKFRKYTFNLTHGQGSILWLTREERLI